MNINSEKQGHRLTIYLDGSLDGNSADSFLAVLNTESDEAIRSLIIDFSLVPFITGEGLVVILKAYKKMFNYGEFMIVNVLPEVYNALHTAGFCGIIDISKG